MSYVVGLTGGIGSGKSAASDYLASLGITVVDADVVAREVVMVGQPALAAIARHFGSHVLNADGSLNRAALRKIVFDQPAERKALEAITHPAIRQMIMHKLTASQSPYTVLVSPLLFESSQHQFTQRTLVVDVSEETQRERASQRDGVSAEQIAQIMAAQLPRTERLKRADDIVINHGTLADLYPQLDKLHVLYLQLGMQPQS